MKEYVRVSDTGEIDTAPLPEPNLRNNVAFDNETTGTLVYSQGFAPRLVQFSFDTNYSWILNPEAHSETIKQLVREAERLIVHNGSYDLAIMDHCFGIPLEETWWKTVDTQEMARLLYPTESEKLNDLIRKEFPGTNDSDKELKEEFKRLKLTPIGEGYKLIPLDNEVYVKYAGLDAIGTFKLWELWQDKVNKELLKAEHALQFQTATMTRRGLLCDKVETQHQIDILNAGIEQAKIRLAEIGMPHEVTTNLGKEVLCEWLDYYGLPIAYTPVSVENYIKKNDGQLPEGDDLYHCAKVGADDLRLTTLEADDFVKGVIDDLILIRQAEKIKVAYCEAFLESSKVDGRVRPTIRTMAARTHRMSISEPPLQQIPTHGLDVELPEEVWAELQRKWENE